MENFNFKNKYYPLTVLLFIIGYLNQLSMSHFLSWLSMLLTGMLSLGILYGFHHIPDFFRPLPSPKWRVLLKYVLQLFVFELIAILLVVLTKPAELVAINPAGTRAYLTTLSVIMRLWLTFKLLVSIVGEEVAMASLLLPLIRLVSQTKFKNHSWPIVNLIGCIIFMFLHLPHYQMNWAYVFIVGVSRYPLTASWRGANSLRNGIYVHWISDATTLLSVLVA
ncbi:CPBP family glutamic-type intramembrane protease [Furfurilactobacillus curtus]|uniref:Bacteriocin immunity protein n=1 Tax=Furfurilactobacillus curtus TaxID=1746200 RepID=A0ABQ5JPU1_9LACO